VKRLDAWLRRRALQAARRPPLEAALLAGRFGAYARYRLAGFAATRALRILVHLAELILLWTVLPAGLLARALVVANGCMLLGAFWWGALELLRMRLRAETSRGARGRAIGAWLGAALVLASALLAVALAAVLSAPALDVAGLYALVCVARLAADVVVRTLYSGVAAVSRIFRPLVSLVVADLAGLAVSALLVGALGGWVLPISLLIAAALARALAVAYTLRAYRALRLPPPRPRPARGERPPAGAFLIAGLAGAAGRSASWLVLLFFLAGDRDGLLLAHLLAPAIVAAGSWPQVFYLDLTRMLDSPSALLRLRFDRSLLALALLVAPVTWAAGLGAAGWAGIGFTAAGAAVLFFVVAAQSLLAALQLTHFVRGRFGHTLASGVLVLAGLAAATRARGWAPLVVLVAMAAGVALLLAAQARLAPRTGGLAGSLEELLEAARGAPLRAATVAAARRAQVDALAAWMAARLGGRGAVLAQARRVVWFEAGAPPIGAAELVVASAGLATRIEAWTPPPPPAPPADARFRALVPGGVVVDVARGRVDLPFDLLQSAWRDAVAGVAGRRVRGGAFDVTTHHPRGTIARLYLAPRTADPAARSAWRRDVSS
jgi:hypothetical protein